MANERRRYPRASIEFTISIHTPAGPWEGKAMNLSPVGIKVAPLRQPLLLQPGTSVQVRFPERDREFPFLLPANVQRVDSDGVAFSFGNLGMHQFKRLKDLVDSDLQREWQELLRQIEAQNPPPPRPSPAGESAELDRWQGLLIRLGFDNVQLPNDGTLTRQWRDFLARLEAEASRVDKRTTPEPR